MALFRCASGGGSSSGGHFAQGTQAITTTEVTVQCTDNGTPFTPKTVCFGERVVSGSTVYVGEYCHDEANSIDTFAYDSGSGWSNLNYTGVTVVDGGFKVKSYSANWNGTIKWFAFD